MMNAEVKSDIAQFEKEINIAAVVKRLLDYPEWAKLKEFYNEVEFKCLKDLQYEVTDTKNYQEIPPEEIKIRFKLYNTVRYWNKIPQYLIDRGAMAQKAIEEAKNAPETYFRRKHNYN